MEVTLYYIDGSRSNRDHVTCIEELADGEVLIRREYPEDEKPLDELFNQDHIALMSVRRGAEDDDNDPEEEDF